MSRQFLNYPASYIIIGNAPAWNTGMETGRILPLIQDSSLALTTNRVPTKQVGSQQYSSNQVFSAPDVEFAFGYFLSPYLPDEIMMGFNAPTNAGTASVFNGFDDISNNLYMLVSPNEGEDAFDEGQKAAPDFSGFGVVSMGNMYLTDYSVAFSIGAIPKVTAQYIGSNIKTELLTGNYIEIPAINLASGNNVGAGQINLTGDQNMFDYIIEAGGQTILTPKVAIPHASVFTLENLQVGGVPLSAPDSPILQSFNANISIPRSPSYGFGSNYVFDRKIAYPIQSQISLTAIMSGVDESSLATFMSQETGYAFDIAFSNKELTTTGTFQFSNAKLESFNHSLAIGGRMEFSASFSVEVTETTGFSAGRAVSWDSIYTDPFGSPYTSPTNTYYALS